MLWTEPGKQALVATGSSFCILDVGDSEGLGDRISHRLTNYRPGKVKASVLRSMEFNPLTSQVMSGGYDRMIHIWSPERLFNSSEIDTNIASNDDTKAIQVSGVVGSVHWHPGKADVISWTLDHGVLELQDLRCNARARSYDSTLEQPRNNGKKSHELFTHQFIGECVVLLGFSNGVVKVLDLRKPQILGGWADPNVGVIGDIEISPNKTKCATFGIGGYSAHNVIEGQNKSGYFVEDFLSVSLSGRLMGANRVPLPAYACKTAGTFIDESFLMITDSGGSITVQKLT